MSDVMARFANPSKPKKGRKKARSPAQKAATARMLAARRAKLGTKKTSGGAKPSRRKGMNTMAKKRRKSGSRPKRRKGRTAAQRAATARLVAMNKARKGGKRRSSKRRRKNPAAAAPASNPSRRRTRRKRRSNPAKKRHTHWAGVKGYTRKKHVKAHKRRTNPSLPAWARIAGAAVLGAFLPAAAKAIARKAAPQHAELIGHVAAGAAVLGAISFGKKYPLFAPSLAAGSVAADLAPTVSAKVERMLAATNQEAAVAEARLQGVRFIERLGAVTADDMGAVTADDMGYLPESPYGMGINQYVT